MTGQEQEEYYRLDKDSRRAYDRGKVEHPNWGHSQLMVYAKVNGNLAKSLDEGGKDTDPKNLLETILQQAKEWLSQFTSIGKRILDKIDDAISSIRSFVGDLISDIFDFIFG